MCGIFSGLIFFVHLISLFQQFLTVLVSTLTIPAHAIKSVNQSALSSKLVNYSPTSDFRDTLRFKMKLVKNDAAHYGYGYSLGATVAPKVKLEESLPPVVISDSSESGSFESNEATSSGEDLHSYIGVETTSVPSILLEKAISGDRKEEVVLLDNSNKEISTPATVKVSGVSLAKVIRPQESELEDVELFNGQRVESTQHHQRFKAAVRTKHTFEYRPVTLNQVQEPIEPKVIEVEARSVPLEIHFKSASSRIKLVQSHKSGELNENVERTSSDEEPQRLFHLVRKPIIQEVREIITPYRRIVQEIQPVMEEIHTVIAHEDQQHKLAQKHRHRGDSLSSKTSKKTNKKEQTFYKKDEPKIKVTSQTKPATQSTDFTTTTVSTIHNEQNDNKEISSIDQGYAFGASVSKPDTEAVFNRDEQELEDSSVEVIDANDIGEIMPAKLMHNIMDYNGNQQQQFPNGNRDEEQRLPLIQPRNQQQNNNHHYYHLDMANFQHQTQHQTRNQEVTNFQSQQHQQPKSQHQAQQLFNYHHQQAQQPVQHQRPVDYGIATENNLRASASNQNWQAIRPYIYYEQARQFPMRQQYHQQNNQNNFWRNY